MYTHGRSAPSSGVTEKVVGCDGRLQINGKAGLKDTQAYPIAFGRALAKIYQNHQREIKAAAEQKRHAQLQAVASAELQPAATVPRFDSLVDIVAPDGCADTWPDADLALVFQTLQGKTLAKLGCQSS